MAPAPNRLRDLRAKALWTQGELAEASGVSVSEISRIELGAIPTLLTQERLAQALGIPRDALGIEEAS